jgi:hypothetical protein
MRIRHLKEKDSGLHLNGGTSKRTRQKRTRRRKGEGKGIGDEEGRRV